MADPRQATGADIDAKIRGSVLKAAPLAAGLARIVRKRPRTNALKRSAAAAVSA